MAQWNGQYTGNTHSTRVKDLEEMLRHAIDSFREAETGEESIVKEKNIRKLADKLLVARLKVLKAKLYDAESVTDKKAKNQNINIELLRQQETKSRSEGVKGILIEFGAQDLII